uniref:Putative tick metalloprotease 1 n=1 Tax=Amblyomma parvum TaxID=251391 RepID=A0A023G038_AMBPA
MWIIVLAMLGIAPAKGLQEPMLVYPRLLEERSSDGRMVVHVHDDLTLSLRKASVAAPELKVLMVEDGRPVTRFYNGKHIERDLYEDEDKIATVAVRQSRSGVRMEGLVGPSHRIEPLSVSEKSEDGVVAHRIYEIEQKKMLDKTMRHRDKAQDIALNERRLQALEVVPEAVTVEVFIVVDVAHYKTFTNTSVVLQYLCVVVNAANLRYRAASQPRVKLMLTGVEKSEVEQQNKYAFMPEDGYLFDDLTILQFKQYAYGKRVQYGYPDAVYLMTGLNVITFHNGKVTDAGLGIGFVSSVCTKSFVALGEDSPGLFSGVHTFTHEMAHILGAYHDGEGPKEVSDKHPGAKDCPWEDGHIMSYVDKGPSHHQFSTCSLKQIQYVLRKAGKSCWKVLSEGHSLDGVYPGMTVSFGTLCGTLPTDKNNSIFEYASVLTATCKVKCFFEKYVTSDVFPEMGRFKISLDYQTPALDYMPCGNHHRCIQGVCQDMRYYTKP